MNGAQIRLIAAALVVAAGCSLNPQPLPPYDEGSGKGERSSGGADNKEATASAPPDSGASANGDSDASTDSSPPDTGTDADAGTDPDAKPHS